MKKTLALLIALITVIVCVPISSVNADPVPVYTISVTVPQAVVPGQTFDAGFTLSNTSCDAGISGGSVVITFDTSVLEFSSITLTGAPDNWILENWTKTSLPGVLYLICWDETQSSNALPLNSTAGFDVTFRVKSGISPQNTEISVLSTFEIAENDYYYTEIIDSANLDTLPGTLGSATVSVVNDVDAEIILKSISEYETYDDVVYYEYNDDEYVDLSALHIENIEIDEATTLEDFLDNIENADDVRVFDKYGDEILDDYDEITTGCVAKIISPYTSEVLKETPICVKGDLNGDGVVTFKDLAALRNHLTCDFYDPVQQQKYYLKGVYYLSAKFTGYDELTFKDFARLKNYLLS